MTIRFDGRVAIVTGAGNGLGRAHALALAGRGAKVVINDLGASLNGERASSENAEKLVAEIRGQGGEAIADGADVSNRAEVDRMVERAMAEWGRVDILVNNAGILRDKTFAKIEPRDFAAVLAVHLNGAVNCTQAVWGIMRAQQYGRIVMTSSASGIYGNFGQSNYGAAKAGVVGLMNVLHLEGEKYGIRVNTLAPTAATRMTQDLLSKEVCDLLAPEAVSPAVLYLVSEDAPSRVIVGAGAGVFAVTRITESEGVYLDEAHRTPEEIARRFDEIADPASARELDSAFEQTMKFVRIAALEKGIKLN
jgi:NAD(P)-dependent dehydrogenase (short-subunit alcohol dehydrogenase family)